MTILFIFGTIDGFGINRAWSSSGKCDNLFKIKLLAVV
jgi:hypothetical protein